MSDGPAGPGPGGAGAPHHPEGGPRVLERLDESECLQLIGGGRLGRLVYSGRLAPLRCRSRASCTKGRSLPCPPGDLHRENLRTGIVHVEYQVAFGGPPVRCGNPRRVGRAGRGGPAHHVDTEAGRASIISAGDALGPSSSRLRRSERMFAAIPGIWPSRSLNCFGPPSSASTSSSVHRSPTLASARQAGTSRSPVQP
jgi:hypothetical protein